MNKEALDFFRAAEQYVKTNHADETMEYGSQPHQDANDFLEQYLNTVLDGEIEINQVHDIGHDPIVLEHPSKRKAVVQALTEYQAWFAALEASDDKTAYLASLPMIDEKAKHQLAKKLGVECTQQGSQLEKLAENFGYPSVQHMCEDIANQSGYHIGTVNMILWRYCKAHSNL